MVTYLPINFLIVVYGGILIPCAICVIKRNYKNLGAQENWPFFAVLLLLLGEIMPYLSDKVIPLNFLIVNITYSSLLVYICRCMLLLLYVPAVVGELRFRSSG